jgi:hypothetical protein
MSNGGETTRVAFESERRARLAVPVTASGVLYLIGAIIIYNSLSGLPTVGVIQGLEPALSGRASTPVSPRAGEIRYLSHHAFGFIAGSTLEAIGIVFLTLALLFLLDATRFRAPESSPTARSLVLFGGVATALVTVLSQVVRAIRTHDFAVGHNFTTHAVERAAYTGTANVTVETLSLLLPVVLVVGMVIALLRATRVGLIPRWLRTLGIVAAVLLLPFFTATLFTLQLIPAAWLVAMGFLFMGRLPGGDPPAWASGESVPWPPPAGRARGGGARVADNGDGDAEHGSPDSGQKALGSGAAVDSEHEADPPEGNGAATAPMASALSSQSKRRRRKRGGRH